MTNEPIDWQYCYHCAELKVGRERIDGVMTALQGDCQSCGRKDWPLYNEEILTNRGEATK
jgi:hypothetical protein